MTVKLAIDGGTPVRRSAWPAWPAPGDEEAAAVERVVRSGRVNYWTGDEGRLLESAYREETGREHALAVANGTLALELALRALRVGAGDEVVVPARTFIATAAAVVAVGATPVVCDVEADSGCMSADAFAAAIGPRTRAVIPVHVGGWPADMPAIVAAARGHGVLVVEDCAQAHGAAVDGVPAGALGSDAAAFSFCQDKVVPAGEGGLLLLDDGEAYERAWSYRDHGKSPRRTEEVGSTPGSFCWLVDSFGSNFRMTEMASALARAGLAKLPAWHEARTRNALALAGALRDAPALDIPLPPEGVTHAFYRLYASLDVTALREGWDRDRVIAAVTAEGVPVQYGTCAEIYREQAFAASGLGPAERLPIAAELHESSLAFFVHPTVGATEIEDAAAAVRKVLEVAAR